MYLQSSHRGAHGRFSFIVPETKADDIIDSRRRVRDVRSNLDVHNGGSLSFNCDTRKACETHEVTVPTLCAIMIVLL